MFEGEFLMKRFMIPLFVLILAFVVAACGNQRAVLSARTCGRNGCQWIKEALAWRFFFFVLSRNEKSA